MRKEFKGRIELDIRDSTPDWDAFLPDKAPERAPNLLIVLYDDTGQAAWSPYGSRIEMSTLTATPTTEVAWVKVGRSPSSSTGRRQARVTSRGPRHSSSQRTKLSTSATSGSPVTNDYDTRRFNRKVKWVEIDVGLDDDHNHLITPEQRVNLAMAFQ